MVKLSRLAKIRENHESFPPRMFQRIRYVQIGDYNRLTKKVHETRVADDHYSGADRSTRRL